MRRLVTKFGGTSLGNGDLVRKAAKSVKNEWEKEDTQIAVVVSAMGGTTDSLIEAAKEGTKGKISQRELDSVMSMGEITSAKVFAAALESVGVDAEPVTPESPKWPVITDGVYGNATPDLERTRELVMKNVLPMLEDGTVPVLCGFLGKNEEGNITTLGRGGSDVTAFLISNCLEATDVVLVTDAEGVMSADPRKIGDSEILDEITAEEITDLARYGSKIVHHNALRYKVPDINAKVIHYRKGDLSSEGTIIKDSVPRTEEAKVEMYPKPLSMITVVGEDMQRTPGILNEIVGPLKESKINIFGISIGPRSFSVYVTEERSREALDLVHDSVRESSVMKSATCSEGVAMILAESEEFIDTPGVISELSRPLAEEEINVIEIYSSQASISFFVNWGHRNEAYELVKDRVDKIA
ncbi:MAG: aspartate kinase [Candidatus Hadarchaeota archaeon]